MIDWQPIETAPKDGTDLILFQRDDEIGDVIFIGYWSTSIWVLPGAWVIEEHRSDTIAYSPTHWMPLPPPPSTEQ